MSLTEMMSSVQTLSREDKIRLMEYLARELECDVLELIDPNETYWVGSPHQEYEAVAALSKLLEAEKGQR